MGYIHSVTDSSYVCKLPQFLTIMRPFSCGGVGGVCVAKGWNDISLEHKDT